jgi:hypothetical protein
MRRRSETRELASARALLPDFIPPELATLLDKPPEGSAWLHEIKFDGYRTAAGIEGGKVGLLTRTGLDWTARFRPIATALASLPVKTAYLDGAVLGPDSVTSFATLLLAMSLPEAAAGDLSLDLVREWGRGSNVRVRYRGDEPSPGAEVAQAAPASPGTPGGLGHSHPASSDTRASR